VVRGTLVLLGAVGLATLSPSSGNAPASSAIETTRRASNDPRPLSERYASIDAALRQQLRELDRELVADRTDAQYRASFQSMLASVGAFDHALGTMPIGEALRPDVHQVLAGDEEVQEIAGILARAARPAGFPNLTDELGNDLYAQQQAQDNLARKLGAATGITGASPAATRFTCPLLRPHLTVRWWVPPAQQGL
jgi:hypothetical protein